jgi:hypothetical protein
MDHKKTIWDRLTYIITNIISPILAIAALYVAWVALGVANKTYSEGASLNAQQKEIKQLSDLYETQLRTNRSLQNGLDSQSRQINELKKIYLVGYGQFQVSKKSLTMISEDRSMSNEQDKYADSMAISSALFDFIDFYPFINPPNDGSEPHAEEYDSKISSMKQRLNNLTTNKSVISQKYELANLFALIEFMDITHAIFLKFNHKYPLVDFMIEKDFLIMRPFLRSAQRNDSSTSINIKNGLDRAAKLMSNNADSVFKAGHYH